MSKLRICINAINMKSFGIANYTKNIIKYLKKSLGDKIEFTIFVNSFSAQRLIDIEDDVTIVVVSIKTMLLRTLYMQFIFPFIIRRFDIIHSVNNFGLVFSPIPQIITLHDTYEKVSPERFKWSKRVIMTQLIAWSGRTSKEIITVSHNTLADIKKYYKHLFSKSRVVYSGCSFPETTGLSVSERFDVLFVGTIEPGKNLITAVKALSRMKNRDVRLNIIGARGWGDDKIFADIKNVDIENRVNFIGSISDSELIGYYKSARVLVFPSTYEGFGLPVIEAQRCGCPVVAANNSALPEAGGDAARYYNTMDHQELAELLDDVLSDDSLARNMQEKGLIHARSFNWESTAHQTLSIYKRILNF